MKKKGKAHSIALASTMIILFFILVSFMASASPEQNSRTIAPPDITSGTGNHFNDDVLSSELYTEGNSTATETTPVVEPMIIETRITNNTSNQHSPAIYGDRIVWEDNRNGNADIYMYEISTRKETQTTTNESEQWIPDIYGNRIVWEDTRNEGKDIYMYDLSTKKETRITTDSLLPWNPSIYGDKVVWTENPRDENYEDYDYDIYMYDLSTSKEKRITTEGSSSPRYPAIYGNRIVWTDDRNGYGNSDIYMYDLYTHKETKSPPMHQIIILLLSMVIG